MSSDKLGLIPFALPATLKYWLPLSDVFQNWDIVIVHLTSNNKFWEINLLKVVSIPPLKVKWRTGNGAQVQVFTELVQDLGPIISIKNTSEAIMSQVAFLDMHILWCGSPGGRTGRNGFKKREWSGGRSGAAVQPQRMLSLLCEEGWGCHTQTEWSWLQHFILTSYWMWVPHRGPHDLKRDNSQSRQFQRRITRKGYILQLWVMVWGHQQLLLKWLQNVMGTHKMLC